MNPLLIIQAIGAALSVLEWAVPALARAFKGLLDLIQQVQAQAKAGDVEGVGASIGDAATIINRAIEVAKDRLPNVQGLDFGTGNVTAEKMLKLDAIAEGVKQAMAAEGTPVNKTIAVTAAQLAFAAKRAEDPSFGQV